MISRFLSSIAPGNSEFIISKVWSELSPHHVRCLTLVCAASHPSLPASSHSFANVPEELPVDLLLHVWKAEYVWCAKKCLAVFPFLNVLRNVK